MRVATAGACPRILSLTLAREHELRLGWLDALPQGRGLCVSLCLKGMRCGGGLRLAYSNPMHLDDVAIDFPDMQIVNGGPGRVYLYGGVEGRGAIFAYRSSGRRRHPYRYAKRIYPCRGGCLR